jgi:peptide/nickel transport system substrate-binding protein
MRRGSAVRRLLVGSLVTALLAGALAGAAPARFGGTLTIGLGIGDPTSLDHAGSLGGGIEVLPWLCEQLYAFNAKSQVAPQLASALPTISPDHLTYTIPLREGIVFNDGTAFNADAVVTSIERVIDLPGSLHASDFGSVASVTATNESTVVIHLKARFTPLLAALATTDSCVLSPAQLAKQGSALIPNPIGVGPFMFDHRDTGVHVTLIKSPYYYDKYAVHLDKLVFRPASDGAAAVAALEAGDLQVLSGMDPTQLPAIQGNPNFKVIGVPQFGYRGIVINIGNKNGLGNPFMNVGTPLASSPKLRQAFEEAIDRQTLVKVVLGGIGVPGCTPIAAQSAMYDPTITCTPYDPADAKKLVAQSGLSNPTVHLLIDTSTVNGRIAQFIQAEEANVGIDVVIDTADTATASARRISGGFDTVIVSPAGTADSDRQMFPTFATSGSMNYGGYSNPLVDLILANGRKATNPTDLKTLYDTAEHVIQQDRPLVILYHGVKLFAISSSVAGVQPYPDLVPHVAFAQYR